jgi:superfamily II DNA or RNA helicase
MHAQPSYSPGSLVRIRGREWVVLPDSRERILRLRTLSGSEEDASVLCLKAEREQPVPAVFPLPDPQRVGSRMSGLLLRDALRLRLRSGAGPFRSFGSLGVEPRAYQLVPLLMALRMETVRLLIADDVGVGKTIEAGLVVRELLDRGEIRSMAVICPPHLCEQWQQELSLKFGIQAEVVRTSTAGRLERILVEEQTLFEVYPFTIVSLDFIKSERRRSDFLGKCPDLVIVEEAHSSVHGGSGVQQQRYALLQEIASDPGRHMLFLTATPHSGNDDAFFNLLGLLRPEFRQLQDADQSMRRGLRDELALHFVQRRRPDIQEWKDATAFPDRESAESTYVLTGGWKTLFEDVVQYARQMVSQTAGLSLLRQRMGWWAALALLRCISSSPAAAALALRTRLQATDVGSEQEQLEQLEARAAGTVLDGDADDSVLPSEIVPAGTLEDREELIRLVSRADALRGPGKDPKLAGLLVQLRSLVKDGFQPVIFCRYIATAHYVAQHLREAFEKDSMEVVSVTGELAPEDREARIERLAEFTKRILVATDCLSEGINLQNLFNAVVHYDLTWNPTRHEQREGRVDRFGQPSRTVRVLMYYGENNPVDGAVLQVILRKAERIRRELGVNVPMPADSSRVMDAIMQTVLLRDRPLTTGQLDFVTQLDDLERDVNMAWESARDKAKQSQTIFAQRRLKPEDVLPEWERAVGDHFHFPVQHLPRPLQERLEEIDLQGLRRISFSQPAPSGVTHVHRAHPLLSMLAGYVVERALEEDEPELTARCGAMFTHGVTVRTTVFLLRMRSQLVIERGVSRGSGGGKQPAATIAGAGCPGPDATGTGPQHGARAADPDGGGSAAGGGGVATGLQPVCPSTVR